MTSNTATTSSTISVTPDSAGESHEPSGLPITDGLIAVVKKDCATCVMVAPVLRTMSETFATSNQANDVIVLVQDDPSFFDLGNRFPADDTELWFSWHHKIETVPTLIEVRDGREVRRTEGWLQSDWREYSGITDLGSDLPAMRPGCGSLAVDPSLVDALEVKYNGSRLTSARVEFADLEDPFEAAFDRGWTDGLPVVPPTEARVLRMLTGTEREPGEVVATVPPNLIEVTVEQIAINAVMAGCKPEYLEVVIAAVQAACTEEFNMHGLLSTTYFSGPVIVVNGPIAKRIGMNSGGNLMGQGNRANMTIGRALNLIIRNIGGGIPGKVDMSMHGSPGKLSFCFAEREEDSPFSSLAASRGIPDGASAVTLFAGQGPTPIIDQLSRDPESLARSIAAVLRATHHPKLVIGMDAMVVISPEHGKVFSKAGWDRGALESRLSELLLIPGSELVRGVASIDEGLAAEFGDRDMPKFRPGGLPIVFGGGDAGLFSSVISGWVGGPMGSDLVTQEIQTSQRGSK